MNITVFLADDHAVVRDGLSFLLDAKPDITVVGVAANGRQAANQVAKLCPDVVIMDIAMPELNGIDATREIGVICPSARVIILSMYVTTEHVMRALRAGAVALRGFCWSVAEVVDAVRTVHAGHRYLSRQITDQLVDQLAHQPQSVSESPLARLSPREREVLQLVVEGQSSAEIADSLSLSVKTVETYRSRIMVKLDIHDLPGLVKFAIRHGLTPL